MALIAVLDYGIGNLRSAQKALERVGADARLTADPGLVRDAAGVVLPGVGNFGRCMEALEATGLDDVDPAGTLGGERLRLGHRVVGVDGLLGVVALVEANASAVAQVDGGEQVHHAAAAEPTARATKLARMRMPVAPDFSGWNCVAHRAPCSTAAVTGPP